MQPDAASDRLLVKAGKLPLEPSMAERKVVVAGATGLVEMPHCGTSARPVHATLWRCRGFFNASRCGTD
jgi:hypothetical protein